MGTNYYHERVLCEHCGNAERTHIGKSSHGWTFSFHATDTIRSYADWLVVLAAGGRIVDEYGTEHSLDAFKEMVEAKRREQLNHARVAETEVWGQTYRRYCFLDADGHSFSDREFS